MVKCLGTLASLALLPTLYALRPPSGPQAVNFWRLDQLRNARSSSPDQLLAQDTSEFQLQRPLSLARDTSEFRPRWFKQPLDHLYNETADTWWQRYWISTRHYKPGSGGPVVVLDGGEADASEQLAFLDTGIVDILTRYLGGVGVILEHRYYGKSHATHNLTTDSLRFLNNEQALADSANFMANVKFAGIEEDLTAPKTPWIYYGGSYAGARSALMRVVYPDLVYGAIASSGVTEAFINDWEYYEVIRRVANSECRSRLEAAVLQIDSIIAEGKHTQALKTLFGLQNITHDEDFVSTIAKPVAYWQDQNWDPNVGEDGFDLFCSYLNATENANIKTALVDGYPVDIGLFNYGKYIREGLALTCTETQDECFGTFNDAAYQTTTLDQTWRLWQFQICTQWGFLLTAPPDPNHPRIVSSLLTVDYQAKICQQAFLPGDYFTVPPQANVSDVNQYGGYAIAADRLAIIDGEVDPWRPCTAHAFVAAPRTDTIIRPFKLIPNGVHHYDQNGLANIDLEPPEIRAIHLEEVAFVGAWLRSFNASFTEY